MLLLFPSAAGGEIFDQCVADRDEAFTEKDVQRLMRQILEGVCFLHAHDVVHLDLKVKKLSHFPVLRLLENHTPDVKCFTVIYSNICQVYVCHWVTRQ